MTESIKEGLMIGIVGSVITTTLSWIFICIYNYTRSWLTQRKIEKSLTIKVRGTTHIWKAGKFKNKIIKTLHIDNNTNTPIHIRSISLYFDPYKITPYDEQPTNLMLTVTSKRNFLTYKAHKDNKQLWDILTKDNWKLTYFHWLPWVTSGEWEISFPEFEDNGSEQKTILEPYTSALVHIYYDKKMVKREPDSIIINYGYNSLFNKGKVKRFIQPIKQSLGLSTFEIETLIPGNKL